jgi:hypothetical protein
MQYRSAGLPIALAILAALSTTAIISPARATVTWSFFETGISCVSGQCFLPLQPFVFATLALPGPISQGTAQWLGFGPPPVYTGDDFILSIVDAGLRLSPAFDGDQGGQECGVGGGRRTICDFDISWSAAPSFLNIGINLDAINDNIGGFAGRTFGSFGGSIATDFLLGGCENTQCVITGFWQSDLAMPEPSTASLALVGLIGSWFTKRHRRQRRAAQN